MCDLSSRSMSLSAIVTGAGGPYPHRIPYDLSPVNLEAISPNADTPVIETVTELGRGSLKMSAVGFRQRWARIVPGFTGLQGHALEMHVMRLRIVGKPGNLVRALLLQVANGLSHR